MESYNSSTLSCTDLIKILEDRNLKIPNLRDLSKNDLIKIYKKFALPLSQRPVKSFHTTALAKNLVESNIQTSQNRPISLKRNFIQISKCDSSVDDKDLKVIKLQENEPNDQTNLDLNLLNVQKRLSLDEHSCNESFDKIKLKRFKITWP